MTDFKVFIVAVYDEDRAYGGPEEGGWWYTYGELSHIIDASASEDLMWEVARAWNDDVHHGQDRYGRSWPRQHATVVELPRDELIPELRDQACHGDLDDVWDEDGQVKPEYRVTRWDVPEYVPEKRPHYC